MIDNFFSRKEVWHPLSVHFPIAILLMSTLFMLFTFFIRSEGKNVWQKVTTLLLSVGCATAWLSVYTGNLADGLVSRKLCDPTILKDHEIAAEIMTYLFTSALAINLLVLFDFVNAKLRNIVSVIVVLLMLGGSFFVIQAGHLGARLVYQQGAGVYKHTVDCAEFE